MPDHVLWPSATIDPEELHWVATNGKVAHGRKMPPLFKGFGTVESGQADAVKNLEAVMKSRPVEMLCPITNEHALFTFAQKTETIAVNDTSMVFLEVYLFRHSKGLRLN